MIPEPDYSDSEEDSRKMRTVNGKLITEEGLVLPKKLPNPCLESSQRVSLHRELLFNQKIGRNVLGQKSELDRALEKMREEQKRKELERERMNKRTDFEKKLAEQADKIKQLEDPPAPRSHLVEPELEFLRVHARLRSAQPVDQSS